MQNLSDRDIAYDLLYGCKSSSHLYMQAVLESASPRCREVFHHLHDDGLRSQWKIWRFLHNRNEYRTEAADRREIDAVRQRMEHLARTHQDAVRPQFAGVGGREVEGGRWNEGARWDDNHENHEQRWNEAGQAPYGAGTRAGSGYGAPAATYGTGNYGAGTYGGAYNSGYASGAYAQGASGTYASGTGGYAPGAAPATGAYAGAAAVNFEAGRNMPEGTRFEADRGFAEGYDAGRRGNAPGSWGEGTYGGADRGRSGAAGAQGRWNTGTAGRFESQGAWNERHDGPTGGNRAGEGARRTYGENTWSAEGTRRAPSAQRY